jgi:hypothetical protein
MHLLSRWKPSPALVVAGLALLVALGGTSVAAVSAVPKNSVATPLLKNPGDGLDGAWPQSDRGEPGLRRAGAVRQVTS